MKRKTVLILLSVFLVLTVLIVTQLTFFVIQPIGALPEGKTLVILRLNKTKFIDSADAMCRRIQGSVNLLCRGASLAAISENGTILLRLPYSETLYLISTGGEKFDR